jgi:NAD(P)-dependent dehydrogenase (short-subunit alcohol dehydrogenase family)
VTARASETGAASLALVTSAGSGIGAACARALAAEGFRVALHYRSSAAAAHALAEELAGAFVLQRWRASAVEALVSAVWARRTGRRAGEQRRRQRQRAARDDEAGRLRRRHRAAARRGI